MSARTIFRNSFYSNSTLAALGIRTTPGGIEVASLPFRSGDATAGTENELQAVVVGHRTHVDLPLSIRESRYYANITKRAAAGETPGKAVSDLQRYLNENPDRVWENSWVRFPRSKLSAFAQEIFDRDLLSDKQNPSRGRRSDAERFIFKTGDEEWLRIPVSYLIKLALADAAGSESGLPSGLRSVALLLMDHFSCDLTSPETFSFHLVHSQSDGGFGRAVACEMSRRFLFVQLLVQWANKSFALEANGQQALVYFAPHPPVRQRELNDCIPDAFYRELFINPCLNGWDDGEAKQEYMYLAHQITSRSQLNALAKLRAAGIIANNLVILPNTSNISLSNNGTHVSLSSRKLADCLSDPGSGFTCADEKQVGDLVIKICEHFLPLFVGTYTAAPYRLAFSDFHPERVLSFLPHELDYTHLRMLWRHWKRKAHLRVFGRPITPYGPKWLDESLMRIFRLRGDLLTDFRLVDYPVAWLSTEGSSALDGTLGNVNRLKSDLENLGVTDRKLKLYLLLSLREYARMGFSGFEARYYSLFFGFTSDLAPAVDLQQLITVLALKYALSGTYNHRCIPDDPSSESERRQAFFCAALGLPAFYVRADTPNLFLRRIARLVRGARFSHRHSGYLRIPVNEYRRALVEIIRLEGSDVIEMLGLSGEVSDLAHRLHDMRHQASGKLLQGILSGVGRRDAMRIDARKFNQEAERYYRGPLRLRHTGEALEHLREDLSRYLRPLDPSFQVAIRYCLGGRDALQFLEEMEAPLLADQLSPQELRDLILLVLAVIAEDIRCAKELAKSTNDATADAPVYRTQYAPSAH